MPARPSGFHNPVPPHSPVPKASPVGSGTSASTSDGGGPATGERLYLEVPYADKGEAKERLGARWIVIAVSGM
ncbi:DUF5710 domain-containing protein [Streptomyces fagopyri]|uniref:DUF5710 domain-containing protein n=1 Tax=Streptomyces fagopyri TaxID=2662397 RepID=UPI002AD24FBA|nr:DUF5710 domain-containing protein [Streptomyces fagopyri]